jgi:hypothetical protein
MKQPPGIKTAASRHFTVLCVSPNAEDGVALERIFRESDWTVYTNSEWTLIACPTVASASSALRDVTIPIVFCECDLLPGTWREVLEHISFLPDPPPDHDFQGITLQNQSPNPAHDVRQNRARQQ